MKFAQVQWLWGLLVVSLLLILTLWGELRSQRRRMERLVGQELWSVVVPELDWRRLSRKILWVGAAAAFAIIALARPQMGGHEETARSTGLDIMIALDVSNSMLVEDIVPDRLRKAKHVIRSLTDRFSGDRMGLIAFAGSAYVASPLTTDLDYVREVVETQFPTTISNQGTDLKAALETARKSIERGAEDPTAPEASRGTAPSKLVILISDGEDQEEGALEEAKKLAALGVNVYALGVGTERGGPIPIRDDQGNLREYKKDRNGQAVLSTFKPKALQEIARVGGGKYWDVTVSESELEELAQATASLSRGEFLERKFMVYEERFYIPLVLAIICLFIAMTVSRTRQSSATAKAMVLIFLILPLISSSARALPLESYIENERGLRSWNDGKSDEAGQHFGAAQALDPQSPLFDFNQGAVQAKKGDLDSAMRYWNRAAEGASKAGDSQLSGQALFNMGDALSKSGHFQEAAQAYTAAIKDAKAANDSALEGSIRKNIELLKVQQEQQQQQKQQEQNQQQQQQQAQDDEKSKQERQKNQYSQNKKQPFKSQKLSPEDAERVMNDMREREKNLQSKMNKKKGAGRSAGKDW